MGGGTPSLLDPEQLERLCLSIRERWDTSLLLEWSIEMNPSSSQALFIDAAVRNGINRFSLGVQSFSSQTLEQLQREHNPSDIHRSMKDLHAAGISNINLDLIHGVPGQTKESVEDDLQQLIDLSPSHVSLYNLQFEEGTGLRDRRDQGLIKELEEELQVEMYKLACTAMSSAGLEQYEISNYSQPGHECQHNLTYWRNKEYIGAGAGAWGYLDGVRYRNHCSVDGYIEALESSLLPRAEEDRLMVDQQLVETLITGLRLREGIDWVELEVSFGADKVQPFRSICEAHHNRGLMETHRQSRARLTTEGILVSNAIFETLVQPC